MQGLVAERVGNEAEHVLDRFPGRQLAARLVEHIITTAAGLRAQHANGVAGVAAFQPARELLRRSEEHTSELQSLMRISYAVFCLKKKKRTDPSERKTMV